jgi:hypothetical protein
MIWVACFFLIGIGCGYYMREGLEWLYKLVDRIIDRDVR